MQEAQIGERIVSLPEHHDGDREWLSAQLYAIESRKHPSGPHINEVQRYAMMRNYESIYQSAIACNSEDVGPSLARREANTFLRERIDNYRNMMNGVSFSPELA